MNWEPAWIDAALEIVRDLFNDVYASSDNADNQEGALVDEVKESPVYRGASRCIPCSHPLARTPTTYLIIYLC